MIARLAELVLDHGRWVTSAVMLLCLAAAAGLPFVRSDLGVRVFLPSGSQSELAEAEAEWGRDDLTALVLVQAPEAHDLLDSDSLGDIRTLRQELRALSGVLSATGPSSVPLLRNPNPLTVPHPKHLMSVDVVNTSPPRRTPAYDRWRAQVLGSHLRVPALLSADGKVAVIALRLQSIAVPEQQATLDRVRTALTRSTLDSTLTGPVVFAESMRRQMALEGRWILPATFLILLVLLSASLRSWRSLLLPLLLAGASLLILVGGLAWLGRPLGPFSQAWMSLLPAVAVADALHLVRRVSEETAAGKQRREAVIAAMSTVVPACAVTSLTTAAGLLALTAGSLPVVQQFGVDAAAGVIIAFILFLALGPLLARAAPPSPLERWLSLTAAAVGMACSRRRRWVWACAIVLGSACAWLGSSVVADQQFSGAVRSADPAKRAAAVIDAHMGGTLSGSLELSAAPGHLLSEPVLRTLAEAEDQSELHLLTTATAVREALVALHGERADAHLAQAAALAKHVGPGPLLLSEDQRKGRVLFRMPDPGARGFVRSVDALHHDLQRRLGPLDVQVKPTGTALLAYRGVLQTSSDLLRSLAIAVVVIGLIVGAVLRSIRGVMLTIIATTIPLLVAWGFLGAFDWRLQAGLAMVFTLGLGLAVDDTVHLLVRYREEQDSGPGALQRAL
ncbi:MAG: putative RND superfamily exporter protein, partial [Kiritimatiellia bacterium]